MYNFSSTTSVYKWANKQYSSYSFNPPSPKDNLNDFISLFYDCCQECFFISYFRFNVQEKLSIFPSMIFIFHLCLNWQIYFTMSDATSQIRLYTFAHLLSANIHISMMAFSNVSINLIAHGRISNSKWEKKKYYLNWQHCNKFPKQIHLLTKL